MEFSGWQRYTGEKQTLQVESGVRVEMEPRDAAVELRYDRAVELELQDRIEGDK